MSVLPSLGEPTLKPVATRLERACQAVNEVPAERD